MEQELRTNYFTSLIHSLRLRASVALDAKSNPNTNLESSLATAKDKNRSAIYAFGLIGSFYFFYIISAILFFYSPNHFYFRAWEFFDEIVFHSKGKKIVWEGLEKGDGSRSFLFQYQEAWQTRVSCNEEGFRSVPYIVNSYPILILGDSHTWGSGLSDEDTIAWKISEKLKVPIFNAGRAHGQLEKIIDKSCLQKTQLIIEFTASQYINQDIYKEPFIPKSYIPLTQDCKPWYEVVPPKRYFLPYKLFRYCSYPVLKNILLPTQLDEYQVPWTYYDSRTMDDLEKAIINLTNRAQSLKKLGYEYVFVPVPSKHIIQAKEVNQFALDFHEKLVQGLLANGVHSINLTSLFREKRDQGLFIKTDSHWSKKGVEIASEEVIAYLKSNHLIEGLNNEN